MEKMASGFLVCLILTLFIADEDDAITPPAPGVPHGGRLRLVVRRVGAHPTEHAGKSAGWRDTILRGKTKMRQKFSMAFIIWFHHLDRLLPEEFLNRSGIAFKTCVMKTSES